MTISWQVLKERLNQISGFELSVLGGISWQPKELDVTKARKLIEYLDDKRVLYYDPEWEFMDRAIQSVQNIRKYLVENVLMETEHSSPLYNSARELRDACHEFLELVEKLERQHGKKPDHSTGNFRLMRMTLGVIRRRFARALLTLAVIYQIDLPENLATTIPVSPNYEAGLVDMKYREPKSSASIDTLKVDWDSLIS